MGQCVRAVSMTTLTSFLANGIEGALLEANSACAYTPMGVHVRKPLSEDVFERACANVSVNV